MANIQAIVYELSVMEGRVEELEMRTRSLQSHVDQSASGEIQIALAYLQEMKGDIQIYSARLQS